MTTRSMLRPMLLAATLLAAPMLAFAIPGQTQYLVTVNTSSLAGDAGIMDLQFNAGALTSANGCVTISYFTTDGTLGSPATTTGSVSGSLSSSLVINNGSGGCTTATSYTASTLNDYQQPITFGNTISFLVTLAGPALTCSTCTSGSSFGVAFISGGNPALTGDPSNFAGVIGIGPAGGITTQDLAGPGNSASDVTIETGEPVTVTTSPSGLSFTVDNNTTPYTSSQTFAWAIGSPHTLTTTTPQGSSGTQYNFSQWSDGTTTATDDITVTTGTTSYTADFNTSYLLTTTVNPSGDGTVTPTSTATPVSGYYPSGAQVSLEATPTSASYSFTNWTGTTSSTTDLLVVTMTGPVTETANFSAVSKDSVTIATSPTGLLVSVDGSTPAPAPQVLSLTPGQHTITTSSPQDLSGTQYTFSKWSDNGALSHAVTISGTATYTATFKATAYLLTTAVNPSGDGTVTPTSTATPVSGYYPSGAQVSLKATPTSASYKFTSWTGTTSSTTNPLVVTMTCPVTETANFSAASKDNVTVATSPTGLLVSVDGSTPAPAPQAFSLTPGQHTIATSSPQNLSGTQYTFSKWSDNGVLSHAVTISGAATYTATFKATAYLLTTAVNPPGTGTVAVKTASPTNNGYFAPGTKVSLSATANSGYNFVNWTGAVANSASASTTVTMNAPETVVADFGSSLTVNPTSINFGTLYLGSIVTKTVTLTNNGSSAITINDPLIVIDSGGNSSEFVTVNLCARSLAPGRSCAMTVTFLAGPFYNQQTATLKINDSAAGSPQTVALTALVIDPVPQFSPGSLSFGTVKKGVSSGQKSISVTNVGGTALSITKIALSGADPGDFSATNTCTGKTLNPTALCSITVTFMPTAKGSRTATLLVTGNARNSPQSIPLSGTGD